MNPTNENWTAVRISLAATFLKCQMLLAFNDFPAWRGFLTVEQNKYKLQLRMAQNALEYARLGNVRQVKKLG